MYATAQTPSKQLDALQLTLTISDPECIQELIAYDEGLPREQYALCALRVGLLAMKQARGKLDGETLRREGDALMASLKNVLTVHATGLNTQLTNALREYFDPQSGRFHERIQSLIKKDGDLEQVMRRLIGANDSELCKTLAAHVGNDSALMKILSPKESEGILKALSDAMNKELTVQRECVLREFSLDNEQSALKRLVTTLTANHGDVGKALQDKIDVVMKEFSLDKEDSALKRMTDGVKSATDAINTHLTLDQENSALSRLKRELTGLLDQTAKNNQDILKEVRETLVEFRTRRAEISLSPQHGREFEQQLFDALVRLSGADLVDFTKDKVGLMKARKVGDVVVELGAECVAAGAKIVFEAKDEAGYRMTDARSEIEIAKQNRGAKIGVFVFAKANAPLEAESFRREGDNIFVIWDVDNPLTDVNLKAAVEVARALCTRQARQQQYQSLDTVAFEKALLEIQRLFRDLSDINTWAESIDSSTRKIKDRVAKSIENIDRQINKLSEFRDDLKAHLNEQMSG